MRPTFDLLQEDWIACVYPTGVEYRGILAALGDAPAIRGIGGLSPTGSFGAYRFLLALLGWAMPVNTEREWRKRESTGGAELARETAETIRDRCIGRFDLLDAEQPFLQDGGIPEEPNRPVSDLLAELPSATEISHFFHARDDEAALCAVCCAEALVRLPAFCMAGGRGLPPSLNDAPPVYFLPVGNTLLETLLLNWPVLAVEGDRPSWEGTSQGEEIGELEGFTWRPRGVRLGTPVCRGNVRCSRCGARASPSRPLFRQIVFVAGRRRSDERERRWRDPHVAYVPKRTFGPTKAQAPELAPLRCPDPVKNAAAAAGAWRRIIKAVLDSALGQSAQCPVAAISRACSRLAEEADLRIQCFQPHTRQAKGLDEREDMWVVPAAVRRDVACLKKLGGEIDWLGDSMSSFRRMWVRAHLPKRSARRGEEIRAALLSSTLALESEARARFRRLVREWDPGTSGDQQIQQWRSGVREGVSRVCRAVQSHRGPGLLDRLERQRRLTWTIERTFRSGGDQR